MGIVPASYVKYLDKKKAKRKMDEDKKKKRREKGKRKGGREGEEYTYMKGTAPKFAKISHCFNITCGSACMSEGGISCTSKRRIEEEVREQKRG